MVSIQANGGLPGASDSEEEELQFSSERDAKDRPPYYHSPEHHAVVSIRSSTSSPLREPLHTPVPAEE